MVMSTSEYLFGDEIPFLGFRWRTVSLLNIGYDGRSLSSSRNGGGEGAPSASACGIWDATIAKHDNDVLLQIDYLFGVLVDLNRGGGSRGRR